MGVSIREYARLRGVSDKAVRNALKQGRITAETDGTIDVERANREWAANTAPRISMKAVSHKAFGENNASNSSDITAYREARRVNEVLKAEMAQVRLDQLKGKLIDRDAAVAHVFRLARQVRDAWQTWPSRISGQMAAELGVDSHQLHVTLERYIREHLKELSNSSDKGSIMD